jgi:mRNA deadenylase 3'-5' endonuclease subunit Ccr4
MRSKFFLFTTLFLTSLRADSFTALTYNILNKDFACQELYAHASLEDLDCSEAFGYSSRRYLFARSEL